MKYLALVSFLLTACAADLVKTEPSDPMVKTIGLTTGTLTDDRVYRVDFERASEKACGGDYAVLERTRNPSTLKGMELKSRDFYWVIKCGGKTTH